jgi:heme-degrading monooxygenase HmoA
MGGSSTPILRHEPDERLLAITVKKATGDVETLWQRVAAQPGLVTAYVLANVADMQDGLVLSIWESEEAFDAYAASSLRADVEAVGALDRKNYHVLRATV